MVKTLCTVLITLLSTASNGQIFKNVFLKGLINKKNGDSIICLVKTNNSYQYDKRVEYKLNNSDSVYQINISEIKKMQIDSLFFENVLFYGKEKILPIVERGKITLFFSFNLYKNGYNHENYFVAEKDSHYFAIENKTYKFILRHLTYDCHYIFDKIGKKGYKYDDVLKIITAYNNCETTYSSK